MSSSRPGQAASLLFNFSVVLVAATSVAFGLDWMRAPLPPMPETEASVQAAKLAAHLPPPRAVTVVAKAAPRSVYPARPGAAAGNAVAAVNPTAQDRQPSAIAAPEPAAVQTPAEQPKCDIAVCSAAYHSFRASDCTWQPFDGPRRFCDKGNPPQSEAAVQPDATADAAPVSNLCDVEACRRAYFTFTPADCTYQPSNGPRRLCDKGHPPQRTALTEPAAPTPAAAAPPGSAPVASKCDVEACKQAYFTFNSADCTYQPSDGPRRLCTKGTPPKAEAALTPPPAAAAPPPLPSPSTAPATPPPQSPAPNTEPPKQEAAVPAAVAPAAPPSPAPTAPADSAAPPTAAPPAAASAPVSNRCDVEACKQAYFTFNPADCSYQPSDGPRRLCTKGTPPNPEAALTPPPLAAAPPPNAEPAASPGTAPATTPTPSQTPAPNTEPPKQEAAVPPAAAPVAPPSPVPADIATSPPTPAPPAAASAPVSDKCDVEACKQAYFTFNPADCTYKPSSGPRRLCTKGAPPKPQAAAPANSQAAAPSGGAPRRTAPNHLVPPGLVPSGR